MTRKINLPGLKNLKEKEWNFGLPSSATDSTPAEASAPARAGPTRHIQTHENNKPEAKNARYYIRKRCIGMSVLFPKTVERQNVVCCSRATVRFVTV